MTQAIKAIDPNTGRKKTIISINRDYKQDKALAIKCAEFLTSIGFQKVEVFDTDYSERNWRP